MTDSVWAEKWLKVKRTIGCASRHLVRGTKLKKEKDAIAAGLVAASSGHGAEGDAHPED
jgi:hypothetical protein